MHRDQETLTQKESLPASSSDVFRALTDPQMQMEWTASRASGETSPGNSFALFDGFVMGCYLDLQTDRRILQEWWTADWPVDAPPSIVEITLEEKGDATAVTLVHSLIPREQAEAVARAWTCRYWGPLRAYFERMNAF